MLQRDVSDTLCIWTLQEALTQAECELIRKHILPHCTRHYLDRFMSNLISKSRWNDVDKLLQCVEEKMSTWSVDGQHVDSKLLSLIVDRNWSDITALLHKAIKDSYSHAETFITGEYEEQTFAYQIFSRTEDGVWEPVTMDNPSCVWGPGGEGFPSCWSHLHSVLVVIWFELDTSLHLCVHFHCAGHQLHSVFTDCVRKFSSKSFNIDFDTLWVDNIAVNLIRGINYERRTLIVVLMRHLFTKTIMWALGEVLKQGPHQTTVPEITTRTARVDTNQSLSGEQVQPVGETKSQSRLSQLVTKGRWRDVGAMLTKGVGDSQHEWLFLTACLRAREKDFVQHVLPHCSDRLLDSVLTVLIGRGAWLAVVNVLRRGVSDSKKQWALLEACLHCEDKYFIADILPHCADDMLDSVVTILGERHLWLYAVSVLERGVSDCKKRWVVQKALEEFKKGFFHDGFIKWSGSLLNIVAHCADDQMDDVLEVLVKGRQWRYVGEALKRNVSDSVKRWAVHEACAHDTNKDTYLINEILPHCVDDMLDSVVTILAKRHLWGSAVVVLEKGVSDCKKRWVVQKACEDVENGLFEEIFNKYQHSFVNIVAHCADDMLDSVVTILAERHQWRSAVSVLERGVSDCKKRWVVQKALEDVENGFFDEVFRYRDGSFVTIVDDRAVDQLDDVLEALAKGQLWRNVGDALKRNVSDSVKLWAVQEACPHYEHLDYHNSPHYYQNSPHYLKDDDYDYENDDILINYILPRCDAAHLQSVLPTLAEKNHFKPVRYVLERKVSDVEHQHCVQIVFMHARESLINKVLPCCVYGDIRFQLGALASRKLWRMFLMLLHRFMIDTFHSWAIAEDCSGPKEGVFWDMVSNPCDGVKELSPAQWRSVTWSDLRYSLKDSLHWDTLLCELLCTALLGTVREIWLSGREKEVESRSHTAVEEARSVTEDIHQQLIKALIDCKSSNVSTLMPCMNWMCPKYTGKTQSTATRAPPAGEADPAENSSRKRRSNPNGAIEEKARYGENGSRSCSLFQFHFLKYLTREYNRRKAWTQLTDAVLVVLTTTPVVPGVQSAALRIMVREKRWDVIRHACLSCVCEQDRRQVFQAAVKQRQWGAVKRWADYSLYDDQRLWALGEAKGEKRWDVYLQLADQGLNEGERMGVLYRVAMHADWKLVRHMLNTVADVSHMKDLLTNARPTRLSRTKPAMCQQRIEQLAEFEEALKKEANTLKTLKTAAKQGKWQVVLYNIRHKPDLQHARRALKAAVSSEAWQTVIQLVRLETDVTRRDSLFRDMVRQQQWAVCRELLEQSVSDEQCLEALNDLMEHRQWTLVAMVIKCAISEKRRTEMMYRALMMREGSVVWQCINSLQRPLPSEQRENIFQLAFKREVWQAVKPLVEKKDETGIRHRDTALLEAIEQHQWDVVDHCQRHHADINMKDKHGHTPIHRAARKKDWEAVKELTMRDGDPNLLDSEGHSVLHMTIEARQWDLVKLLIQFHGDIHLPTRHHLKNTGLNMLIDARQIDVIGSTFMWCADQWKGANNKRETTLHAACLSGWPDILHDLIARRVDPLAVTSKGLSALCYAVLCRDCPHKMVAECIKLGFSVHQPHITRVIEKYWSQSDFSQTENREMLTCPLVLAVIRGLPVVTQMLYESGACSYRQLFLLTAHLDTLTLSCSSTEGSLGSKISWLWSHVYENDDDDCVSDTVLKKKSVDYLQQMSSTPRSLVSTCRLVISRCLTLSKTRHRDIAQLPLSPMLKNYLMFTDLTETDFVGHQE
ncbi:uncharacterized protein [Littorina saxatilis]|uniref:uncharacterized protein n=1 Tax=Littorina saxatilis TaxID=31220 RepID=UPI0038B501A5